MFKHHFHINAANELGAKHLMWWQQPSSHIILNSLLTHLSKTYPPKHGAPCPVFVRWSGFRLPFCCSRKFSSLSNITCLLLLALVLGLLTLLSLLILGCPRAPWRPRSWPTAQYPYPVLSSARAHARAHTHTHIYNFICKHNYNK